MKKHPLLAASAIKKFRKDVYAYYKTHKRVLPWRDIKDPYRVLVSEVMLQQTQVRRVLEKYEQFLRAFPNLGALSRAALRDIMRVWQGLGYNRRALALKDLASVIAARHRGKVPQTIEELEALPGIGKVSARAIYAFAYNKPSVFIETNIRSVFIHYFFKDARAVTDEDIASLVAQTLDRRNPRQWYYALMDYGVALKEAHPNPGRKSAHYRKQAPFQGSRRQVRGAVLKMVLARRAMREKELERIIPAAPARIKEAIGGLVREGMLTKRRATISIA